MSLNPAGSGLWPRLRPGCLRSCVLPRRIGKRSSFVVVPERVWQEHAPPERMPLGQWLVENVPRGIHLEVPDRRSNRKIPIVDEEDE